MKTINEDRNELEDTLSHNDAIREEERVCIAHNTIIFLYKSVSSYDLLETSYDESSGSGRRQIPTKPVISSNKSFTFPAERKFDNKETPLKQPHQDTFTSKQETLEKPSG